MTIVGLALQGSIDAEPVSYIEHESWHR